MADNDHVKIDRRSFLKASLLSWPALVLGVAGLAQTVFGKERSEMVFELKSGPEVATDCTLGGHCRLVAQEDFTLLNPHNALDGHRLVWEIIQADFVCPTSLGFMPPRRVAFWMSFLGSEINGTRFQNLRRRQMKMD